MEYVTSTATLGSVAIFTFLVVFVLPKLMKSSSIKSTEPSESAIFITGGSRGIGRDTADYLLAAGYHTVFVTVRKQSQYDEMIKRDDKRAPCPVLMDVSNDEYTTSAVERVKSILDKENIKLVAIVNNAGINPENDLMGKPNWDGKTNIPADPKIASQVFATNIVGVARVSRAFLPLLCDGGRVINIGSYFGSIAGKHNGMGHAYYESSKFALEGLTDNMRRTLKKEGKYAALVKPGNISTDMNSQGEVSTSVVAKDIEHAISSKNPKPRYYPGKVTGMSTRLACLVFEILPTWVSDML